MRKTTISLMLFLSASCLATPESSIKIIPFVKNKVVSITASTFNVTEIQFDHLEQILSIQNGDIAAWTVDVDKNKPNTLFIKPTLVDSNTNMTVMTNQRTYYFHLISQSNPKSSLYALKFQYPQKSLEPVQLNQADVPEHYHWSYSFSGATSIMPLHVFDDGRFTYFQLRAGQLTPAIFAVDNKKGNESVVNFRRKGHYLIVHRLAPQFTLRSGKYHVASIFNDRLIRMSQ